MLRPEDTPAGRRPKKKQPLFEQLEDRLNPSFVYFVADVVQPEGNGTNSLIFEVQRDGTLEAGEEMLFSTSNGSATEGSDYVGSTGTFTWAAEQSRAQLAITVNGDTDIEADETFSLSLSSLSPALVVTDDTATATLQDDDSGGPPTPTLQISDVSLDEGDAGTTVASFTVSLSAPSTETITVEFETADGSAASGSDYASTAGLLTFTPGTTSQTINVDILGDLTLEDNEVFSVNLSGSVNATIVDAQGLGTINNDDAEGDDQPGRFSFSQPFYEVREDVGSLTIFVLRTDGSAGEVTVDYRVEGVTARPGSDFTITEGTLTFAAGQLSASFTIPITNDIRASERAEFANIVLSNPTGGATLALPGDVVGLRIDDDDPEFEHKDEAWLHEAYLHLLGRPLDPVGRAAWMGLLDQGIDRTTVLLGIVGSVEYRAREVNALYVQYLRRQGDAGGLQGFVNLLANGGTYEQVAALILSSDEYFTQQAGGSLDGYVHALYRDVLGRSADPAGFAGFRAALGVGTSRFTIASILVTSQEAFNNKVISLYQRFLGRTPVAGEQLGFVNSLLTGNRIDNVLAVILGSDEYFFG